ncbi:dTDP-4-dehydrorhamnose reductase [Paenalcaligenes suwonensis]|uniref:dTDP-4-dehydrorhamnose reductase n=1 Tax=Paenalcaligenes suwonensis TaxID=1202713 RepID=UPI0014093C36|nr:dTDP-4-dehydrorhamnose reductase [Paenalcaligenes suwonensis]NHC60263.1 dTDP-4-dehydrorhamnose reductase [Paenalcaligenes suwonensis]
MDINKVLKVFICGGSGMLGRELLRKKPENIEIWAPSSADFDVSDENMVLINLGVYKPDVIINSSAYTEVEKSEINKKKAYKVNKDGPRNLGKYAQRRGIPVFHISTDYVFDGENPNPYSEEDKTNPVNVYGKSKLEGEEDLLKMCSKSLILRTSWLFSKYGDNFLKKIIRKIIEEEEIKVVNDQYGSPTSAEFLAEVIWEIFTIYRKENKLEWGIYHYTNYPYCSWYEFAVEINKELNIKKEIEIIPISQNEYKSGTLRPKSTKLCMDKIFLMYKIKPKGWLDALRGKGIQDWIQRDKEI